MTEGERRLAAIMFTDVVGYTALTEQDEPKAIQIRERHRDLVKPLVAQFQGQVIDATGDEILSVFPSSLLAVDCALAVQASLRDDPDLKLRIGIHLGDILMREAEVVGEGVNVASRIRPLADPGGIAVSGEVYGLVRNRAYISGRALGSKSLKNVSQPVEVFALDAAGTQPARRRNRWVAALAGCVAVLAVGYGVYAANRGAIQAYLMLTLPKYIGDPIEQEIGFATTTDGIRIAYATTGQGPPVVFVLGWITHLERGLTSPLYDQHDFFRLISRKNLFVRYDGRGFGLSDRDVSDFSLDARVRDLEAVTDALGLERFALYAVSAGGPTAVAYAARHPERVSRLVFQAAYARGMPLDPEQNEAVTGALALFRSSWSQPAVRSMMVEFLSPDADEVQRRILSEFLLISSEGPAVAGFGEVTQGLDTSDLAVQIKVPTLVIHGDEDTTVPLDNGRHLASVIPGARLEIIRGLSHVEDDPALIQSVADMIVSFLAEDEVSKPGMSSTSANRP